ncbi:hypothetical protein ID866_3617 [Astraeus odoratus]|nr:hypothetical protein ID866_3617 [Astraeus odoratus]
MSSRDPMWYCHECNAEMRPLMTPDPVCASCHSSFVEMLGNSPDDPRQFHQHVGDDFDDPQLPGHMDNFLRGLRNVLETHHEPYRSASPPPPPSRTPDRSMGGGGFRFEIHTRPGGGGTRHVVVGGPNTLGRSSNQGDANVPTMSEFLRHENNSDIRGALMAQYLLALLGRSSAGRGGDPFSDALGGQGGRWGDYVFSQEALDQIMTQLMENSTAGRPVPATDQIIADLPRDVLEEGSPLLTKDCAVCKEQFTLHPDDDGELIVVTLPCKHPFHEDCILPWLKSNGTCPVCTSLLLSPNHLEEARDKVHTGHRRITLPLARSPQAVLDVAAVARVSSSRYSITQEAVRVVAAAAALGTATLRRSKVALRRTIPATISLDTGWTV